MSDFIYRTEDFRSDELLDYFVETSQDREILEELKGRSPVILIGSRGVGKSFLLRIAERELDTSQQSERVLPVYVSFTRSSLIQTSNQDQFRSWMMGRICSRIIRQLTRSGKLSGHAQAYSLLTGNHLQDRDAETPIEQVTEQFEMSWQSPGQTVDTTDIPTVDALHDAVEDVCDRLGYRRIALFFDEAAHILLPEQQRQFFTLFRDLRSANLTCNAAVYPGLTAYGDTFQLSQDATALTLERDILGDAYIQHMREIAEKQATSALINTISKRREHFAVLAYASNGNPRSLLKTLARVKSLRGDEVNELIREYYREEIWRDHTALGDTYIGHKEIVDWGRRFIEDDVLRELRDKNERYLKREKNSSCFFWVHRDAPEGVKEALRLLGYSGLVTEHSTGIRGTRSEIGTRYQVNLGCLFAQETTPNNSGVAIAKGLTPKRMSEYGANYPMFTSAPEVPGSTPFEDISSVIREQLEREVSVLDVTDWQHEKLLDLKLYTVGDVLRASEADLKTAYYVGEVRARRMRNAALAATFEYLSG